MLTYLILDLATRQDDLIAAHAMRYNSKLKYGYESRIVDAVLRAIVTDNWVAFWRTRRKVDGYVRAVLYWHTEKLRKTALKAISRTYMSCDVKWILQSTGGEEMSWEELVQKEDIGWIRDGDKAIIRKPKTRA